MKNFTIVKVFIFFFIQLTIHSQTKFENTFYGGVFYLSEYIASEEFNSQKGNEDDLKLVDHLFRKAVEFYDRDISEALLALTFACLPFNHIKVQFLFGIRFNIPLPSPPKKVFQKRLENLPSRLFFDSPNSNFGDKDKLSHFFGNAFLKYNFGFFNLSKFMGIFVENVEEGLFIEGGYSPRDIIVNNFGELFGRTLKQNKNILPSEILKFYNLLFLRITI